MKNPLKIGKCYKTIGDVIIYPLKIVYSKVFKEKRMLCEQVCNGEYKCSLLPLHYKDNMNEKEKGFLFGKLHKKL